MEEKSMKRVSFEIAKALKDAGYPQEGGLWYSQDGKEFSYTEDYSDCYARPTYYEVWRWMWKEKSIQIPVGVDSATIWRLEVDGNMYNYGIFKFNNDPEEAIEQAIKYLAKHNLIK